MSTDGDYTVILQHDGNFVMYNKYNYPIWATNSYGTNDISRYIIFETDNNLCMYSNSPNQVRWCSMSNFGVTGSNARVIMQNDGNLVVYDHNGLPLWDSDSAGWGAKINKQNNNLLHDLLTENKENIKNIENVENTDNNKDTNMFGMNGIKNNIFSYGIIVGVLLSLLLFVCLIYSLYCILKMFYKMANKNQTQYSKVSTVASS